MISSLLRVLATKVIHRQRRDPQQQHQVRKKCQQRLAFDHAGFIQ
jgi:hypothetical protein